MGPIHANLGMRTCGALSTLAAGVLLVAGCSEPIPDPPPKPPSPDMATVVEGNTAFAFDLYGKLGKERGNVFFSPQSVSTALAMTYAGARGETAEQMAKTLHFTLPPERLHPAMGATIRQSPAGSKPPYELHAANALWGQRGYPFHPDFVGLTRKDYGAGLREVDFEGATEEARGAINQWVEKETREKIKDLVPSGALDTQTRLVLTNAIYFKGTWLKQFERKATREEPFFISAEKKQPVPLMHQNGSFRYLREPDCRVLEMPYTGGDLSMVVLLPERVDGLSALEQSLDAAKLKKYLSALREQKIDVYLPRFRMTCGAELKEALSELGMPRAFSPSQADFGGMVREPKPLFISKVIHKAFVDVNEEGTEAAAATAVVVGEKSARPEVFRADHPFLFLIRDLRTGSILFMGRVADPGQR